MVVVPAVPYDKMSLIKNVLDGYRHQDQTNDRCVLFVHGLTGNIQTTWEDESGKNFIELIFNDLSLGDYDVFSFGYRSKYSRGAPIDNAAKQLHAAMLELQSIKISNVVLIAHSMGGLVCMRYILDRLDVGEIPPITGLLLYGTPTTGSDLVNVAKLVGFGLGIRFPIIRGAVNLFLRRQRQVTDLATGSDFLARLHDGWAFRVVNGGHQEARSQRMWLPVSVITGEDDKFVKEASGKGVYGAIDWLPLSYGHVALVKPVAENDPRYLPAKRFLQICRHAKERDILDPIWKASQDIWASRVGRVVKNLSFQTFINDPTEATSRDRQLLRAYSTCTTHCEYDIILEGREVVFGISIGDHAREEVWGRSPQPVYVHQIGLSQVPEAEREGLRSAINTILAGGDDEDYIWSRLFPKISLSVDGIQLSPGDIIWHVSQPRQYSNWLLRKCLLPSDQYAIGNTVKLKIHYCSIIPMSLGIFSFSTPWIVKQATVRIVVFGSFEYFSASQRLIPRVSGNPQVEPTADRRDVHLSHDGIMLPGSVIEARWQSRRPPNAPD